ncbi:Variant-specific surface protein [Giardia duodenalis]|uniref:Variant-specific surface protein n=1 Tax=Giardia intestinalis TaxID=5741 RepID=V6TNH5_GIAIN|nr:Variant-specific surface protein [Giardia intestinalis]
MCSGEFFLFMGGCYDARAAPGSGVCREARDGACERHAEEVRAEAKAQLSANQCVEVTGSDPSTCKTCGAVIGGAKYCSACNDSGSASSSGAPTDGVCTADNAVCSAKLDGVCTTCAESSFMFEGGCYRTGQAPGQTMCQTAQNGKCTLGANGYFALPEAAATEESVAACNTTTTITLKNSKKYVGVDKCKTCTQPNAASDTNTAVAATCTACENGYFVASAACTKCHESCLTCSDAGADKCKSCTANTYFLGADNGGQGKCVSCGDASDETWKGVDGCLKCTKPSDSSTPATCTEC